MLHGAIAGGMGSALGQLPGVLLGILVVTVDAICYGLILFPTTHPLFSDTSLQVDGIAMFLLSSIIAQIAFALGSPSFRSVSGLMLVEVLPFLHSMALSIARSTGEAERVVPTTIVAFSMSAIACGVAYAALGMTRLGSIVNLFPRPFLIGTIGGIAFFLLQVGFEITTDLAWEWSSVYFRALLAPEHWPLWAAALGAVALHRVARRLWKHPLLTAMFCLAIPVGFYAVIAAMGVDVDTAREHGWLPELPVGVFHTSASDASTGDGSAPAETLSFLANIPVVRLWSRVHLSLIDWSALASILPTLGALVLFAILQISINLPALATTTRNDRFNINIELVVHGLANMVSGLMLALPNYLDYANSLLCIRAGMRGRAASLAIAIGLVIVYLFGLPFGAYVPLTLGGFVNFHLMLTLFNEALVHTYGRMSRYEYGIVLMTVAIVASLGFSYCVLFGIILACAQWIYGKWSVRLGSRVVEVMPLSEELTLVKVLQESLAFYNVHALIDALTTGNKQREKRRKSYVHSHSCDDTSAEEAALLQSDNDQHLVLFKNDDANEQGTLARDAVDTYVIFDLSYVSDMDYTTVAELARLFRLLARQHTYAVLVSASTTTLAFLQRTRQLKLKRVTDLTSTDAAAAAQNGEDGDDDNIDEECSKLEFYLKSGDDRVLYFDDVDAVRNWRDRANAMTAMEFLVQVE